MCPQEALRDLGRAFANFLTGLKEGKRVGFPKFKRKGTRDSFRLTGTIKVFDKKVQLPRLGKIRCKERLKVRGRILSATVSRCADRWFVSLTVEQEVCEDTPLAPFSVIGVDLGITALATTSCGVEFSSPKPLKTRLRKLQRLSKQHSMKKLGSKNRKKSAMKLARLHTRVKNQRSDTLHKLTTILAKNHRQIIIEDLAVSEMIRNRKLSRAITDMGWGELRRLLKYKTEWYGSELIVAPRFFPSSKLCPCCGHVKHDLLLSDRMYNCGNCGFQIPRDLNASYNLAAASWTEALNACGRDVRPSFAWQSPVNQELDH